MPCQIKQESKGFSVTNNRKNYYSYEKRWIEFKFPILRKNTVKKIKDKSQLRVDSPDTQFKILAMCIKINSTN